MSIQKIAATVALGAVAAPLFGGVSIPAGAGVVATDDNVAVNHYSVNPLSRFAGDITQDFDGLTGDKIHTGGPVDYISGAVVRGYRINGGPKVEYTGERPEWMTHQVAKTLDFARGKRGGRWELNGTIDTPGTYEMWIDGGRGTWHLTIVIHERPTLWPAVPAVNWSTGEDPEWGNMSPAIGLSRDRFYDAQHLNVCLNGSFQFSLHKGKVEPQGYAAFNDLNRYYYAVGRISAKEGDVVGLSRAVFNEDPRNCGRQFDSFVVTAQMVAPAVEPADESDDLGSHDVVLPIGEPDDDNGTSDRDGAPVVVDSSLLDEWGELPPGLTDF